MVEFGTALVITCLKLMMTLSFGIMTWMTRLCTRLSLVTTLSNSSSTLMPLKEFIDSLNAEAQDKGEYILESIIDAISDVMQTYYDVELEEDDFSIATSIGPEKFSAHAILKRYAVENNREAAHLTKLLIEDHLLEFLRPYVDAGVNKSIQNFRLLYSHKVGSTWVKEPCGRGYLKEFIISHPQMATNWLQ